MHYENIQNRVGFGIDIHKIEPNIPLIIGGVTIPYHKGSSGHSDGDVLYHSIVDALLGSLSLGDIGQHFPSTDIKWKNANSSLFLNHANFLIKKSGFCINNIDSTIILQDPQLNSYIKQMQNNIADILKIDSDKISTKATTSDKLGYIGNGDGIAATSVVLLSKIS